jgi:3-hydroxyacyl-[acyl-carrier-protein] dehydratase
MAALPHRYPMLLVDRVQELIPDRSITAIKGSEHERGILPGRISQDVRSCPVVLIVEALAQAAGVLAVEASVLADSGKLVYFMAIEGAKFPLPVEPGCLLQLDVEFIQKPSDCLQVRRQGNGLMASLPPKPNFTAMIADPPAA